MTWQELRIWMNAHPDCFKQKTLKVSRATLESVEDELQRRTKEEGTWPPFCGPNMGPLFKGVELIMDNESTL